MAFSRYLVELKGLAPLLLSSNNVIDKLSPQAEVLDWYHNIPQKKRDLRLERALRNFHWLFSGYWGQDGTFEHPSETDGDSVFEGYADPVLPCHNLQRCLRDAGTSWKKGKDVNRSTVVQGDSSISYAGPRDAVEMLKAGRFYSCKPNGRGTMAIRVMFPEWSVRYAVLLNEDIMSADQLGMVLIRAGMSEGLGAWRPGCPKGGRYGRFTVVDITQIGLEERI